MKNYLKNFGSIVLIILGGGILGVILMTLVYCIPIDRILTNFSTGVEGMERYEAHHQYIFDYDASRTDMFTEILMVKAAATPMPPTGENVFQRAMRGYTLNEREVSHGLHFYEYEWNGKNYSCDSYERYWHGYLVLLKPLMYFFSYNDIIFLNIALQFLLIFIMLKKLISIGMENVTVSFIFLWIVSLQAVIFFSLDYAICFYIYMLASLVFLYNIEARSKYMYVFLVVGMLTSFMDFLTWPLITLGIPLVVLLCLNIGDTLISNIRKVMVSSIIWGIGYAGQWAMKWFLGSLILKENIFGNALQQLLYRSSSVLDEPGAYVKIKYLNVLWNTIEVFLKKPYVIIFLLMAIFILITIIRGSKRISVKLMLPHLLVASLPLGWYLVTKNHSYGHFWMAWRAWCVSIFALTCGILACLKYRERK